MAFTARVIRSVALRMETATKNQKSGSSWIDWLLRWAGTTCGIVVAVISAKTAADDFLKLLGVLIGGITAIIAQCQGYRTHRANQARDARISDAAQVANRAVLVASEAALGRRLSGEQRKGFATGLANVKTAGIEAAIEYVAEASEARELAVDLCGLLTQQGIPCDAPAASPRKGLASPRMVHGVKIIFRDDASAELRSVANAIAAIIPDAEITGEGTAGRVANSRQIRVVVGQKP